MLNFGFNEAKDMFANPSGKEHELIKTFCAVKCLISWHLDETATICRERCGGGGYLAYNRICEGIAGGHSGMTAEGDNRVLMQKIVKDVLQHTQKQQHRMPQMTKCPVREIPGLDSVADLETLVNLVYYRENLEIQQMSELLQKKLMTEGKKFYDVWMFEVSDNIQSFAQAFGERIRVESAMRVLSNCSHQQTKEALSKAIRLHCLQLVRKNLDWYMVNGVITKKSACLDLEDQFQRAVKDLAPFVNDFIEGFNIPKIPQIIGPIARDYVKFNTQNDMDNVDAAGNIFDFTANRPKL